MEELSALLREATAAVADGFVNFPIANSLPIYRERVYCYELYHQLRRRWPVGCPYTLNGEVDKRGHEVLKKLNADRYAPDFLVHTPGEMPGNNVIIEVKHALAQRRSIAKDLRTLDLFVHDVGYRRAIYLVYGREAVERQLPRIRAVAAALKLRIPVELWLHPQVGRPANCDLILNPPE